MLIIDWTPLEWSWLPSIPRDSWGFVLELWHMFGRHRYRNKCIGARTAGSTRTLAGDGASPSRCAYRPIPTNGHTPGRFFAAFAVGSAAA